MRVRRVFSGEEETFVDGFNLTEKVLLVGVGGEDFVAVGGDEHHGLEEAVDIVGELVAVHPIAEEIGGGFGIFGDYGAGNLSQVDGSFR